MGIQQMLLGGAGAAIIAQGSFSYPSQPSGAPGYFPGGSQGSISPTTAWSGQTIVGLQSGPPGTPTGTYDFFVELSGIVAQSLFTQVQVTDASSTVHTYTSSSATFQAASGVTFWGWGTGSSPICPFNHAGTQTYQFT